MQLVSDLLFIIAVLFFCFPLLEVILQIFQQTRYDLKRYSIWCKENLLFICKHFLIALFISALSYSTIISVEELVTFAWFVDVIMVFFFITSGFLYLKALRKKPTIKPLVYTFRIYRQITVFFLLDFILIYTTMGLPFFFLLFLLAPFNFFLVFVVGFLTQPLEKILQRGFIKKAEAILQKHYSLVKIGITGSYGKTSTKNIVNEVLSQKYYSLMTPASYNTALGIVKTIRELLKPIHQVFICEMGADRVGDITQNMEIVKPQIGVVTAIGPSHLATFGSQENIINEKMMMIEKLPVSGIGVLNYDNEFIRLYKINNYCKIVTYGIDNSNVDYRATDIKFSNDGSSFKVKTKNKGSYNFNTALLGDHNILNILAAVAIARELDITWPDLQVAVENIKQIEHRLQVIPYLQHTMIDDSFNANPEGAKAALEVLKTMNKPRVLMTSGMIDLGHKQAELNYEFGKAVKGCADYVILVGEKQTKAIYQALIDTKFPLDKMKVVRTTVSAFELIRELGKEKHLTFLVENDLPDAFNK